MRFLSNAHTHTLFCDGRSAPEEMLAAAERLGFVSLGFSGHADQGFDFDYCMGYGKQRAYEMKLRALQTKLRDAGKGPRLWVGLEQDALVDAEQKAKNRRQFDYILGSTHYLTKDDHGQYVAVDGDIQTLKAYVAEVFKGDWLAMAQAYYDAHVAMLRTDRPHIIGHFDLVRKAAHLAGLFDMTSSLYRKLALRALEAAHVCGGVLEVNTGGMARGYMDWPYPSRELLGAWLEMNGAVTVTSDCHDAEYLDYGLDDMLGRLKRLGYRTVRRLGAGDELWEMVEL